MDQIQQLSGWNYLVYEVINKYFKNKIFKLKEIYNLFNIFKSVYPNNFHIDEKIRQTLQNLERLEIVTRHKPGVYQLIIEEPVKEISKKIKKDYVYLVSNESIPGWVKIGRTNSIKKRLRSLYNTSVPFPFKIEGYIETKSKQESLVLEKTIHSLIDTVNPGLRKDTPARHREFFNISVDKGIEILEIICNLVETKLLKNQNYI